MLNPDSNRNDFEAWFSAGLKKPLPADDHFVQQLLNRLEKQKTHHLLHLTPMQKGFFGGLIGILILSGSGALFYPAVYAEISAILNGLFGGLIRLALQPSLESFAVPAAVIFVGAVILWNLMEMLSLE